MTDLQWYYAEGDDRKGPIPTPEFKRLAQSGVLSPDSLVWRHGLDDWIPAVKVKGLFPEIETTGSTTLGLEKEKPNRPAQKKPLKKSWNTDFPQPAPEQPSENYQLRIAKLALLGCLLVVIFSRAIPALSEKYVDSMQGSLDYSMAQFESKWQEKSNQLQQKLDAIATNPDSSSSEEIKSIQEELRSISQDKKTEEGKTRTKFWIPKQDKISTYKSFNQSLLFYFELLFYFAAVLLSCVLVMLSLIAPEQQRWVALFLLSAIIARFLIL